MKFQEKNLVFVFNNESTFPSGELKPQGWGVPTGKCRKDEAPLEAAHREFIEETGYYFGDDFEIYPRPLQMLVHESGKVEVSFVGKLLENLTPPVRQRIPIKDPTGGVSEIVILNWMRDVWQTQEDGKFFLCVDGKIPIYRNHMRIINNILPNY